MWWHPLEIIMFLTRERLYTVSIGLLTFWHKWTCFDMMLDAWSLNVEQYSINTTEIITKQAKLSLPLRPSIAKSRNCHQIPDCSALQTILSSTPMNHLEVILRHKMNLNPLEWPKLFSTSSTLHMAYSIFYHHESSLSMTLTRPEMNNGTSILTLSIEWGKGCKRFKTC